MEAPPTAPLVVGYVRVSTADQVAGGGGLPAQREAIEAECARRGWQLHALHEDAAVTGSSMKRRPGLAAAIADVETGPAEAIVVAKLDRLSRSLIDFATLMQRAQRRGWNLVAVDLDIDLSSPHGELFATMATGMALWERRMIGDRTKVALAARRAAGVRLGRPPVLPSPLVERIVEDHRNGQSMEAIARALNAAAVPTAHGGRQWWGSTVSRVLTSAAATSSVPNPR